MITLDTRNSHSQKIVDEWNSIAYHFSEYELLEIILRRWADDEDIASITEYIKDTYYENKKD